jgi:hypothetical protein
VRDLAVVRAHTRKITPADAPVLRRTPGSTVRRWDVTPLTDPRGPVLPVLTRGLVVVHPRVAILTDPGGPVLPEIGPLLVVAEDVAILTDPRGPVLRYLTWDVTGASKPDHGAHARYIPDCGF